MSQKTVSNKINLSENHTLNTHCLAPIFICTVGNKKKNKSQSKASKVHILVRETDRYSANKLYSVISGIIGT